MKHFSSESACTASCRDCCPGDYLPTCYPHAKPSVCVAHHAHEIEGAVAFARAEDGDSLIVSVDEAF
jgi:hypothetical protein